VSGEDTKPADRIASFASEYPSGQPPGFVRVAASTGGRLTSSVNDFTVGYARARRDLGCRYTIGFYDRKPQEDKSHTVLVFSRVPGLTVYHASTYSFPSRAARRTMAMEAAYMVPSMFEGGGMRAEVFPIEPKDAKTWDALVAVDFPVPLSMQAKASSTREFGAVLRTSQVVYAEFGRKVTLETKVNGRTTTTRRLTFLEPATLSPGKYTLTAVLSDPESETPFTAHADLVVPEIPKQRPFLAGPMIGRRSGPDVVIHGGEDETGNPADRVGGPAAFRPLLVTETDRTQPLFALTSACVSKKRAERGPWRVERGLKTAAGEPAGVLDDALFPELGKSAMLCERFLDQVPVSRLRLGSYTFSAVVRETSEPAESIDTRSASFLLTPTPAPEDPPQTSENRSDH
jgi:hypothetical protein